MSQHNFRKSRNLYEHFYVLISFKLIIFYIIHKAKIEYQVMMTSHLMSTQKIPTLASLC